MTPGTRLKSRYQRYRCMWACWKPEIWHILLRSSTSLLEKTSFKQKFQDLHMGEQRGKVCTTKELSCLTVFLWVLHV